MRLIFVVVCLRVAGHICNVTGHKLTKNLENSTEKRDRSTFAFISATAYMHPSAMVMCVDLRRFYMPYGLEGEHNIRPTKEGLALRLEDEWGALLDLMPIIHAANPELAAAKPCCDNDDHANQLGMLCCSGCNPFHLTTWNAPN